LTAGTIYYLTARAVTSSQTGNYSFSVVTPFTKEGKGGSFEAAIINIPVNEVISGKINVPGKVDYYAFKAPVTGRYQIRTDGISNPTRFTLYNTNQTQINYYDNEYLVELKAGTTYYLTARNINSQQLGGYSFIIVTPHTHEGRGGSFETAIKNTSLNTVVSGEFNVPGKVDYYIFTAPETGDYVIKTDGTTLSTRFTLYSGNQAQINYYDNEYTANLTAGTSYYLTTRAVASNKTGAYSFVIVSPGNTSIIRPEQKPVPQPPVVAPLRPTPPAQVVKPFEPNGNGTGFDNAITLKFDETISGTFSTAGQVVYYAFTAPFTGRYQIKSDFGLSTRFTLYNSNQTQINYYDNEYLVELTAGTIYYLTTRAVNSNQTGDYSFIFTTPVTFNGNGGNFDMAVFIKTNEVISGDFNVPGKVDYFIFTPPVTGQYLIRTDGISSSTRFTLYNSNQTQINYYDNEYPAELTAGMIYYLTTRAINSGTTGEYNFIISHK
jgi:hypothetical protein